MTHILTKTLRSGCLIIAFSLLFSLNAKAQNCSTPPTCESLGYTKNEADCPSSALKCPFDQSKLFCTPLYAAVGDILYSDMSTSPALLTSRKPVGIVISSEKRLAVGLEKLGNFSKAISWGPNVDIPGLTNYNWDNPFNDSDGYYNTQTILAYGRQNGATYPAAEACSKYAPQGMKAGKWFLPSMGEIKLLHEIWGSIAPARELTKATSINQSVSSTEADASSVLWWMGPLTPKANIGKNGMLSGIELPLPVIPMIHF